MNVTAGDFDKWLDEELAKKPERVISSDIKRCKCGVRCDRPRQRYCKKCHAAYMKTWRKSRKYVKV